MHGRCGNGWGGGYHSSIGGGFHGGWGGGYHHHYWGPGLGASFVGGALLGAALASPPPTPRVIYTSVPTPPPVVVYQQPAPTPPVVVYNTQPAAPVRTSQQGLFAQQQYGSGCDLLLMSSPLNLDTLRVLPLQSNAAYVRSVDRLFYINKARNEYIEIPISSDNLVKFNAAFQYGSDNAIRSLSRDELMQISMLTGHVHGYAAQNGGNASQMSYSSNGR